MKARTKSFVAASLLLMAIPGKSFAQSSNGEEAAKMRMTICIVEAAAKLDDGVTQAHEIGAVILRQYCAQLIPALVDHSEFQRFGILRSQATDTIRTHWTDSATAAVLERRANRLKTR